MTKMTRYVFIRRALVLLTMIVAATALLAAVRQAPGRPASVPAAGSAVTPELDRLLRSIKQADTGMLAVSEEDGKFLRLMAATTRAKRALEIGGASGYSAIWIGLGLRETGGRLVTIEYDPVRAKEAADNVRRAGLSDIVQVVHGDAFKEIPKVAGHLRPRVPRRLEEGLQAVPRHRAAAPRPGRPLPRAQRGEQGQGDARLPRGHRAQPGSPHGDRHAVRRRHLDVVQAQDHEHPHHRRPAGPRRRPPRRGHGPVRAAHRRPRRGDRRASATP